MMELSKRLQEPFKESDIEFKPQSLGFKANGEPWCMVLAYVQARAIQERLDQVVGPARWKVDYKHLNNGVMCGLSLWCSFEFAEEELKNHGDSQIKSIKKSFSGEWVTKWDGAVETEVEAFKGGISSALKRTGSVWGIGRYLYKLPTTFAKTSIKPMPPHDGWKKAFHKKSGKTLFWQVPKLPDWALPDSRDAHINQ